MLAAGIRTRAPVILFPAKNGLCLIFHYNDPAGGPDILEVSGLFAAMMPERLDWKQPGWTGRIVPIMGMCGLLALLLPTQQAAVSGPSWNAARIDPHRSEVVHRPLLEQFVLNLKASNHRAGILCWMRFYSLKHNPFVIAIPPDFLLRA